ncbi:MAG TPA: phasin family protein [Acetobacteraceae bacterium]|nr:phasin family protein [Acetobacteraceae bacterium]
MAAPKAIPEFKPAVDAPAAQATKMFEDGATQARAAVEQGVAQATKAAEGFMKAAEQAAEFSRGNMEAMTKAAQLWTVGAQDIARQYFAVAQSYTDQALEGAKALAAVKSLKEAAEIQTSLAKSAMERAMSDAVKLNEATVKLAEQALAPLTARAQVAFEKFGKPLAA